MIPDRPSMHTYTDKELGFFAASRSVASLQLWVSADYAENVRKSSTPEDYMDLINRRQRVYQEELERRVAIEARKVMGI